MRSADKQRKSMQGEQNKLDLRQRTSKLERIVKILPLMTVNWVDSCDWVELDATEMMMIIQSLQHKGEGSIRLYLHIYMTMLMNFQ